MYFECEDTSTNTITEFDLIYIVFDRLIEMKKLTLNISRVAPKYMEAQKHPIHHDEGRARQSPARLNQPEI